MYFVFSNKFFFVVIVYCLKFGCHHSFNKKVIRNSNKLSCWNLAPEDVLVVISLFTEIEKFIS